MISLSFGTRSLAMCMRHRVSARRSRSKGNAVPSAPRRIMPLAMRRHMSRSVSPRLLACMPSSTAWWVPLVPASMKATSAGVLTARTVATSSVVLTILSFGQPLGQSLVGGKRQIVAVHSDTPGFQAERRKTVSQHVHRMVDELRIGVDGLDPALGLG